MLDRKVALKLRDQLMEAVKLIDSGLALDENGTCLHDRKMNISTMGEGPDEQRYLCMDCSDIFTLEVLHEEPRVFGRG